LRSTGIHHIDVVVSSIERSLPFYRDLLGPLGWHGVSEVQGERGETIWYLWGPGSSVGVREVQSEREHPYDRYEVGLHHIAFEAVSRAVVNERAEWLRAQGAEIESGPGPEVADHA
jgi:catechol 2,3-dioxygenase-like lactoylglutathione lyase family enzyme